MDIKKIKEKYFDQIDSLDLDLIIAHVLKKNREFVLAHPETSFSDGRKKMIKNFIKRRMDHEPLAYILEYKEFFGFDFKVNKNTLIPRPETELIVEKVLEEINIEKITKKINLIDVGTGSGNIIISLARNLKNKNVNYFGIDISKKALQIAKENSKKYNLDNPSTGGIKFLHSNLLDSIIRNLKLEIRNSRTIILANLPYLSKEIYDVTKDNVKKFEPRSALLSKKQGLYHYEKLLEHIKKLQQFVDHKLPITSYLEISPEQKNILLKLIKKTFPKSKVKFYKDLAKKWRLCEIEI